MKKCLCCRYVSKVVHGREIRYWTHSFGYRVAVPGIVGDFYALHLEEGAYRGWYICERTTGAMLTANPKKTTLAEALAEVAEYIGTHGGQAEFDRRVQQAVVQHGLPPDLDLDAEEEELI